MAGVNRLVPLIPSLLVIQVWQKHALVQTFVTEEGLGGGL